MLPICRRLRPQPDYLGSRLESSGLNAISLSRTQLTTVNRLTERLADLGPLAWCRLTPPPDPPDPDPDPLPPPEPAPDPEPKSPDEQPDVPDDRFRLR